MRVGLSHFGKSTFEGLWGPLRTLHNWRRLFVLLIRREAVGQTSGTLLGVLWMLAQPALQIIAYWFLIDVVLQVRLGGERPYATYLLVGMLPWLLISGVMQQSLTTLESLAPLYRRSPFPLEVLPLVPLVLSTGIYGLIYAVTVALLVGPGAVPSAILVILGMFFGLLPFTYLLALVGLFIRDLRHLFPVVMSLVLYATPILWAPEMLGETVRAWLILNPFADLMALIHGAIQGASWQWGQLLRPLLWWFLALGPSWVIYRRATLQMREAL